jgi:anti-anti-sigma factor
MLATWRGSAGKEALNDFGITLSPTRGAAFSPHHARGVLRPCGDSIASPAMSDASTPPEFTVAIDRHDGWPVVRPSGELDLATVGVLRDAAAEALSGEQVVLDLSGLSFIDTSGLHYVLQAREAASGEGRDLRIVTGNDAVRRVFEISGLLSRLGAADSLAEAIAGDGTADGER